MKTKKLPWIKDDSKEENISYKKEDLSPLAFVKSLYGNSQYVMDFSREEVSKAYVPYIVNRMLSMRLSIVPFVNEMNLVKDVPNDKQFLFYKTIIPSSGEYFTYLKKQSTDEDTLSDFCSRYYEFGSRDANLARKLLSLDQKKEISKKYKDPKSR